MPLNFPNDPPAGTTFTSPDGSMWQWDTTKWTTLVGGAGGGSGFLPLAGGAMLGPLSLVGPPTTNLQAATKAYVDSSFTTIAANYLPLVGGVLSGPLQLAGPPTIALHAATKAYADLFVPLSGGTMSGRLRMAGSSLGIGFPGIPNGDHGFSFGWDGRLLAYVDNVYVGVVNLSGPFLLLSGGELTGRLGIRNTDAVFWWLGGTYLQIYTNDNYSSRLNSTANLFLDSGPGCNVIVTSYASHGLVVQYTGSGSYLQLYDDGNSHIGSTTQIWIDTVTTFQGVVNFNSTINIHNAIIMTGAAGTYQLYDRTWGGWWCQWYMQDGTLRFWNQYRGDVLVVTGVDGNGSVFGNWNIGGPNLTIQGGKILSRDTSYCVMWDPNGNASIYAGGAPTGYTNYYRAETHNIQTTGAGGIMTCNGVSATFGVPLYGNGGVIQTNGYLLAGSHVYFANTGACGLIVDTHRYLRFAGTDWQWQWNVYNGIMSWNSPGGAYWICTDTGSGYGWLAYNNLGAVGGHGAFINFGLMRNERMEEVEPIEAGLDIILRLNPIRYKRINLNLDRTAPDAEIAIRLPTIHPRREIGFDHAQVRSVLPEAFHTAFEDSDEPKLGFSSDAIIVVLVRAVQELTARVAELEVNRQN